MSPTEPLIYAELLSNIRQISVIVALDAPCGPGTNAELSTDGQQFILQHDGEKTALNLPGQAATNFQLQKPILGNKELSWRIPVAGQATRASIEDAQSNEAPWSAKEFPEDAEFACRDCGAVIVKRGTIKVWKDLPSENWAEMMEFWHCHKPDVPAEEANGSSEQARHVHPAQTAASKGYGATSKFTARAGTGFIDLTTFLLARSDCTNLKVRPNRSLCLFSSSMPLFPLGGISMGIKKVATLRSAIQWSGHRYKCPRSTPSFHSALAAVILAYPRLRDDGLLVDWRICLCLSLRIFLEILEGDGIITRDISKLARLRSCLLIEIDCGVDRSKSNTHPLQNLQSQPRPRRSCIMWAKIIQMVCDLVLATIFLHEIERMRDFVLSEHYFHLLASIGIDAGPMRVETDTLAGDFVLLYYSLY
ncbi:hypothetical protein ACEPPN_007003 [Leptodophora sp. 'Broadleaf-Isolate-01']